MTRLSLRNQVLLFTSLPVLAMGYLSAHADDAAKPAESPKISQEQAAFFESKVRPLLSEKCFSCHGDQQQRGGLRLDSKEVVVKGGSHGGIVTSGEPEKSKLIAAVRYEGALRMPPSGKLRESEILALTEWVKMGAPWPSVPTSAAGTPKGQAPEMVLTKAQREFWSFQPVRKPSLPKVSRPAWCVSPIDRFVLANLERSNLKPAPPADRQTLIRRVTFDLIGLPPTPAQVDAFVNDKSPDAYGKLVDRLLASPHYGERWGRHWLDVVRYADSNGLDENVAFANAFRYRDYVIRAFNQDKPYNDFICEQLAGDQMPTDNESLRNDRITATGMLSLGPKLLAEPDKPKMVMDIVDEQIEVTSKAFLGLTVTCARCHNHKFDPIPTKDYYALAGIFKSTKTMASLNTVAMWQERPLQTKRSDSEVAQYEEQFKRAQSMLDQARENANGAAVAKLRQDAGKYLQAAWELVRQGEPISYGETPARPGDPTRIELQAVKFVRGDTGRDTEHFGKGIGIILNVGGTNQVEWDVDLLEAGACQLEVRYASAEVRPVRLLLNGKLIRNDAAAQNTGSFFPDGQKWEIVGRYEFKQGRNVLRMEGNGVIPHISRFLIVKLPPRPGGVPARSAEQIAAEHGVSVSVLRHVARLAADVRANPAELSPADRDAAIKKFTDKLALAENTSELYPEPAKKQIARLEKALADIKANETRPPSVMAVEDTKAENCRVHIRGDTQNLGDAVPRHFLTVLGGDKIVVADENRSGRLELAQWIARPDHPLTCRVEVNRIWQGHFGTGLVQTPDNYGFLGARPTNAPLLDWLAATFVEQGWSIKKMHKLILMSNTYKMSSIPDAATERIAERTDPDNTLLWKMPHLRLEAEPFRDSLLFVAGKLDMTMGGSLLTSKNHDYVTNDQSGNVATYNTPRRSVYLPIIRNALFDMFQAFDYGDPSMVNAQRSTTTVAPQALYVMNSPFVIEQARNFAAELLAEPNMSDGQRVQLAYMRAFARKPTPYETQKAIAYIAAYKSRLPASIADPVKRREQAWGSFCQLLFASNEFIYIN